MFFSDLAFGSIHDPHDTLTGIAYSPPDLAAALGLGLGDEDMLRLAFWMTRDSSLGIKEAAKLAVSTRAGFADEHVAGKYAYFKEAYSLAEQFSRYACGSITKGTGSERQQHAKLQECLDRIDPRVSEVVQQWLSIREDRGATPRQIQAFLPFLLDDSTRASAWRASAHIRRLGYSLLALHGPPFTLTECDRRGERMIGVDVLLLLAQDIVAECRTLLLHIQDITNALSTPRNHKRTTHSGSTVTHGAIPNDVVLTPSVWQLYFLTSVLRSTAASSTAPPARQQILHFATSPASTYAWPHIHLSAQCEGTFYSLRMLAQILDMYLCDDFHVIDRERAGGDKGEGQGKGEVVEVLRELRKVLETLPAVDAIFGRAGAGFPLKLPSPESTRALEKIMDEVFGREERDEGGGFLKQRGKKRKSGKVGGEDVAAEIRGKGGAGNAGGGTPVNLFELLGEG